MTGSADRVLATVSTLVPGIAATFGQSCEVVLHDYRTPEHSVIAVAGTVTGRQIGDAMSDIGRRVHTAGDTAEPEINYRTRTPAGVLLKSTTLPLRDDDGTLIGALCINVDVTALDGVATVISDLIGHTPAPAEDTPVTDFGSPLTEQVDTITERHERAAGLPAAGMKRPARAALIRDLAAAGVFQLRGASPTVASRLGVSRATLYADLRSLRETDRAAHHAQGADS